MSQQYDEYIRTHKQYVILAYDILNEKLPQIFGDPSEGIKAQVEHNIRFGHDQSKISKEEYDAYDNYFYGNRSYDVVNKFNYAWLHHIHNNPHHWQYWVLINDDPDEGQKILDMPDIYIIEMICDWWSFSLKQNKPEEIFNWYDAHKRYILLSEYTRSKVEYILNLLKEKLQDPEEILEIIEGYVNEVIEG